MDEILAALVGRQPASYSMFELSPGVAETIVQTMIKRWKGWAVRFTYGPDDGLGLGIRQWGISVHHPICEIPPRFLNGEGAQAVIDDDAGWTTFVFPQFAVAVCTSWVGDFRRVIERCTPEELGDDGRPIPWVTPQSQTESSDLTDDEDAEFIGDAPLPPVDTPEDPQDHLISNDEIRQMVDQARSTTGFGPFELVLVRGDRARYGFTTGRIQYGSNGPRRVRIVTSPNSDRAEIMATILHELAHVVAKTANHGRDFKRALVLLAGEMYGLSYFQTAMKLLDESYREVDRWVASAIRAAMRGDEVPIPKTEDDGNAARLLGRLRKLRALAADCPGSPEAISATAKANDLITIYGMGAYSVSVDAGISDQMADRWIVLAPRKVWQRQLAFGIARFFNVFALSLSRRSRMHFFGKYGDIVAAEYLFLITSEAIERQRKRHIKQWKASAVYPPSPGQTRSEGVDFCDNAGAAFTAKLNAIRVDERRRAELNPTSYEALAQRVTADDLARAEQFADQEHAKRQISWGTASSKIINANSRGRQVGAALPVVRGLNSRGGAPRRLKG